MRVCASNSAVSAASRSTPPATASSRPSDGPARAIRCGCAIRDVLEELDLGVRIGIHTGECALVGGKPSGIAVSTGARVAAAAETGEVLVSQTVKDLVAGSGIALAERGERELKGVPGTWRVYSVVE